MESFQQKTRFWRVAINLRKFLKFVKNVLLILEMDAAECPCEDLEKANSGRADSKDRIHRAPHSAKLKKEYSITEATFEGVRVFLMENEAYGLGVYVWEGLPSLPRQFFIFLGDLYYGIAQTVIHTLGLDSVDDLFESEIVQWSTAMESFLFKTAE